MNTAALRTLIIYGVILPLAVFVGWIISGDLTRTSFASLTAIIFVLLLPVLLKWHYEALILSWSSSITIFFLPGTPSLWMLMAGINVGIALFNRIIQKRQAFLSAPSLSLPLLALLAVVLITAGIHGGIGLRSLGSSVVGGRYYYYLIAGVLSYFAFASQIIPLDHVQTVLRMLFLPALLNAVSTVIYYAGPAFYFLYLVFPVAAAGVQAAAEQSGALVRFVGFSSAANFVALYVMARYGIRGILQKWWRVLFLIVLLVVSMLGGYRSTLILLILVLMALFVLEGLLRSPIFPALLLIGTLGLVALFPLAGKLPGSIQRSISFIPGLRIDSAIRMDAEGSTNWRLEIWKTLLPDLPKYVWLGKGYSLDPTDIYLTQQAVLRGRAADFEGSLLTGDYHSGPLSVYVPFGSFGFLAFVTFLITSLRGTYRNYIYGREELRTVNRFVFALFLVKIFFFLFVFGAFANDLSQFAGLAGLSVALNRGICTKPATNPRPVVFRGALSAGNTEPGLA